MTGRLRTLSLDDFLERLASSDPTPGGGAAAALAGATAASLVSMVCRLTIARPRFADVAERVSELLDRSERARETLQQCIETDAEAYERLAEAFRLPRETDEQKQARLAAVQAATLAAIEPPFEIADACAQVLDLAEAGVGIVNPGPISDVEVAAYLGRAGLSSALANVEINVRGLKDQDQAAAARARMESLLADRDEQYQRIVQQARARM